MHAIHLFIVRVGVGAGTIRKAAFVQHTVALVTVNGHWSFTEKKMIPYRKL